MTTQSLSMRTKSTNYIILWYTPSVVLNSLGPLCVCSPMLSTTLSFRVVMTAALHPLWYKVQYHRDNEFLAFCRRLYVNPDANNILTPLDIFIISPGIWKWILFSYVLTKEQIFDESLFWRLVTSLADRLMSTYLSNNFNFQFQKSWIETYVSYGR